MLALDDLLVELQYDRSPHYQSDESAFEYETAHLFRTALSIDGVRGIYVFETSPVEDRISPAQPVVYVADADNKEQARVIHRSLWNLCYAPFIIIRLPHQIQIYTGFSFDKESEKVGLLGTARRRQDIRELLTDFTASSIDAGHIWKSEHAKKLNPDQRVDEHLLKNLRQLGQILKEDGLPGKIAHALIGKYVFLCYLQARDIISNQWLAQQRIDPQTIFSRDATRDSLHNLIEALKDFNGKIFPIDFNDPTLGLKDEHVSWVASVFKGHKPLENAPDRIWQLHLSFPAYDFRYIPVETLSAIYEQFIADKDKKIRKKKGVVYTPEFLADYLLSEVNSEKQLKRGMKILDPACGSGIFLVLAYRRLIEIEMEKLGRSLTPPELRDILLESIYGVERVTDACYVAEFSLILTLLHYSETRQLQELKFDLPDLHNNHIFECDFFDIEGKDSEAQFWQEGLKFDWIVGNPPWIELKPGTEDEEYARAWINNDKNKSERPTTGNRVAEAFSWLVTDLLSSDGVVGLLLPATSLFNLESRKYRQHFFNKHEVLRITNFSNFRDVLFGKKNSGALPAATITYRQAVDTRTKPYIKHYAPFVANQQTAKAKDKPWAITINESEIQTVSPYEAENGETSFWKVALWGNHRDKRALERLRYLFPITLAEFCERRGWGTDLPKQGADFCNDPKKPKANIKGQKRFDVTLFNKAKPRYRFSIPHSRILQTVTRDSFIYRGEKALRLTTSAPHIILSPTWQKLAIYSEKGFIIPPRNMGIAVPDKPVPDKPLENIEYLRALTVYLSSSLVAYYLFFHVPQWGVFSQRKSVVTTEVRNIPTPDLALTQAKELANLHRELVDLERQEISQFFSKLKGALQPKLITEAESREEISVLNVFEKLSRSQKREVDIFVKNLQNKLQQKIDVAVFNLLAIPQDIRLLVEDFVQTRLPLDKPTAIDNLIEMPCSQELLAYARVLKDELDSYAMGMVHHQVTITHSRELIECVVEVTKEDVPIPVSKDNIRAGDLTAANLLAELSEDLREQVSQWVYVQRGLRLFDGPRIYIYKSPRLIDWTRTQALNDASEIIGTALSTMWESREEKTSQPIHI